MTLIEQRLLACLDAIEQENEWKCAACDGEDCACCSIFIDRQFWQEACGQEVL